MENYQDPPEVSQCVINAAGDGEQRNKEGLLHRLDGPAFKALDVSKWYVNGKLHRVDGPAIEYVDGNKLWYINGNRHRIDGPAVDRPDGSKAWYVNGKLHRLDGPAHIRYDGYTEWWINDYQITNGVVEWMKEQQVTWPFDEPTQMLFLMKFG